MNETYFRVRKSKRNFFGTLRLKEKNIFFPWINLEILQNRSKEVVLRNNDPM